MIAQVHVRSQHSNGSSAHMFGGPDAYVAVTIAPEGVEVPYCLNRELLKKRGIEVHYFGEGYSEHRGPKSRLGRAIKAAREFADSINATADPVQLPDAEVTGRRQQWLGGFE